MSDRMATADGLGGGPLDRRLAMSSVLARNWWLVALRGLIAIVFAICALILPLATLASLVWVLGIYLVVDGITAIASGFFSAAARQRWGWLLLEGFVDIVAGLVVMAMPGLTLLFLIYALSAWAIVSGVFMLVAAFRLHGGHGGWLMAIAAIASIVWGALLYVEPVAGAVVLALWLGIYAMIFGVTMLIFGFRLRARHTGPTITGPYASA